MGQRLFALLEAPLHASDRKGVETMARSLSFMALFVAATVAFHEAGAMTFTPGHFYATNYSSTTITEYDWSGDVVESLDLSLASSDDLRGVAFGPDNLLYVTAANLSGFDVHAINEQGGIEHTYTYPGWIAGNISLGKLAFGDNGHFYVGESEGIIRFDMGDYSSGERIAVLDRVFDLEVMPNGNLLAMANYDLFEVDAEGNTLRTIAGFTDGRGVEFDPQENAIYASSLGHTGAYFQIAKLDADTGGPLDNVSYWYADDLWWTGDGRLISASRTQSPGIFTSELNLVRSFEGAERMFVTQFVPEPGTIVLLGLAAMGGLLAFARRRQPGPSRCRCVR